MWIINFHNVWFRFWLFPSIQMLDRTGEDPDPHGPKNSLSNWVESFVELMFSLFAMYIKLIQYYLDTEIIVHTNPVGGSNFC